jgi:hypothetical protein
MPWTNTLDSLNSSQVVKKTSTTIYPYGSKTPLKLIGKSTLKARVNDKLREIEFHIIGTFPEGLGTTTNGLTHGVGPSTFSITSITSISSSCFICSSTCFLILNGILRGMLNTLDVNTDSIISSFKDRFTGLGKLQIDESVQSVAQPVRKIPFKMRKQVEEQIKQLGCN